MDFPYAEAVTVQTAGTITDPYSGDAAPAWELPDGMSWTTEPTSRPESCAVSPGGSAEPVIDARTPIDSDFDLIFDHDPAITAADRVVVRGLACDVAGHPFAYRSPFTGWEPGTVVRVSIREG